MKNTKENNLYAEKQNINAINALRIAWKTPDNPMMRNQLRHANAILFTRGRHSLSSRARTNGAFGNMSKFNKRLKAQANN